MRESIRERSNMNTNEANGIKLVDGLMPRLIAIDHGWSSIKTPNFILRMELRNLRPCRQRRRMYWNTGERFMLLVREEWESRKLRRRMTTIIC